MTHISKALDKYKKERHRSSAQIFNLDDVKSTESTQKEGENQPIHVDGEAASANQATPLQSSKTGPPAAAPRDAVQSAVEPPRRKASGLKPKRKVRIVPADKKTAKTATGGTNKEPQAERFEKAASALPSAKLSSTALSEPGPTVINLGRVDPNLVSVLKPQSLETEIFKVLRAKLLFPTSDRPPRSIMVTSAVPGEGKSFVAANLAVNLAQNVDEHVLLMDCDLRRPTLHRMFGLGRVMGLSEHLANGSRISDLLIKTGLGKLSLLPSGMPPSNPAEILSSAKMAKLLNELKSRYEDRYLVLESPPPMLAPETTAIAKQVDGIIVVIKYGSTPMEAVEELIDNLGKDSILGAVVNRFDARTSRYYGYRKYGKYYRS